MSKTVVIMIAGKSESGKGTVTDVLQEQFKANPAYNVIRCSLSTWIRNTMIKDFYWDGVDTPESRKCMAEIYRVGTEFYPYHMARRVWERDVKRALVRKIKKQEDMGVQRGIHVFEDVWIDIDKNVVLVESFRELVNYDYFMQLKDSGDIASLITLQVTRPEYVSTAHGISDHVSEVDLDNFTFDFVVENKGTVEELKEQVKSLSIFDLIQNT